MLGGELADRWRPAFRSSRFTLNPTTQEQSTENLRAEFYECYHKAAEEYDKESIKRHNGGLNATLILVPLEADPTEPR